jgi:hypothetical protein
MGRKTGYYARKLAEVVRERYLSAHAETAYSVLEKLAMFKSKTGSVTIRVPPSLPRQLIGDMVIKFLEKHGIPFTVTVIRKSGSGFTRRITVLDIPKYKELFNSIPELEALSQLAEILEELEVEYSIRGRQYAAKGKA